MNLFFHLHLFCVVVVVLVSKHRRKELNFILYVSEIANICLKFVQKYIHCVCVRNTNAMKSGKKLLIKTSQHTHEYDNGTKKMTELLTILLN